MSGRTLWSIIFGLILINCITVGYFLSKERGILPVSSNGETIATIGEVTITREQWMAELESRYGKDTLKDLVNMKVVEELAEKYAITVSEDVMERELAVYKSMYNSLDEEQPGNEENWEQQIRYSILLEELLTRDVLVTEKEMETFYENNKDLYSIKEAYHLSHIVVKTEKEANMLLDELAGGSSFEALALEKSLDEFTANQGGDIGFVSKDNEYVPGAYLEAVLKLGEGDWSEPIQVDEGYAIILLHKKLEGETYSYKEVKGQIRRQIALEQMEGPVSAEPLWDEIGVSWFYGKK
ncbi:peptidyl-prolyl cis-trans isomerase [Metabacillus rhizolycopersici]|uniref:peptidylprolyl isomerase n=1 Tax=Metabacillus rhizolycopersici TaxID=2875709 RepID=A0ABS7USA3_9BACI|nr:peptidyl-prolyl cis-trans isomerase [Metabacillus rhizolycopersici]MBZ5751191.1 peptidyl-prolyl cis-trans isomerase [Metabacillus rhizolycopersici]